jgi:hypothetical protein
MRSCMEITEYKTSVPAGRRIVFRTKFMVREFELPFLPYLMQFHSAKTLLTSVTIALLPWLR